MIWSCLPGPSWVRAVLSMVMVAAVIVLLWCGIFPVLDEAVPWMHSGME